MAARLNPPQSQAVRTLQGPLLVLAGAGTGKTRVVTFRIAELIRSGVAPDRILGVTFTNKAAAEMRQRVTALLGKRRKQKPEISTFHSLCVRVLRRRITMLGYPAQFAIYDRGDQESVARRALREIRVPSTSLRPGDLLYFIGRWKNASVRPHQAAATAESDKEHLAAMAYPRYQKALRMAGAVDFDDLLLCTEELFTRFEEARRAEAARFSHLLVDEYQDTNGAQYRIIRALAAEHRNLCVVGDDDQSIYGWRGAEVTHILSFQRDWPDAVVVRLEDNYRSTAPILALANRLIAFNRVRHAKTLRSARPEGPEPEIIQFPDETAEAKRTVEDIASLIERRKVEPRDVAILFRTNEQPRPFETELRRLNVPYTLIGGMSFYDRKEVRDLLSYLKLLAIPTDEVALLRIINTPSRGIGPRVVERLRAAAVEAGEPTASTLDRAASVADIAPAAVAAIESFRLLMATFGRRAKSEPLVELIHELIDTIGYREALEREYQAEPLEAQSRIAAVEQVVNALGAYVERDDEPTLAGFLDEVTLAGREDSTDKEAKLKRNSVVLMTLHSAKGLEFPYVYMVGLEEGLLPHARSVEADGDAIEEERRLCYVGVTRAQDRLTLSLALNRQKWGKPRPTIPSRFLFELMGSADNPQAAAARADAIKRSRHNIRQAAERAAAKKNDRTMGAVSDETAKATKPGTKPRQTRPTDTVRGKRAS